MARKNTDDFPIGHLALEIRGATSAILSYIENDRLDLAFEQKARINSLSEKLEAYIKNPKSSYWNNVTAYHWKEIARQELSECQSIIKNINFRKLRIVE